MADDPSKQERTVNIGSGGPARSISSWTCPTCALQIPTTASSCPQDGTTINAQRQPDNWLSGAYEFIEIIGSGGMSVIYKARQIALNKLVAIKMLHSHLLNDQSILRFQQEARAASSLKHPNIIAVHDFGVSEQGQPYMVMEFIDGFTLADVLSRQGALPLPNAMDIFLGISSALEHAHQHGILHRDLKPSNVMLSKTNESYAVHLVDFGIAKILDSGPGNIAQQLTSTGEIMGSPLYMSPEQCMGRHLDQRSDIYSFGCILYESVVGVPPHRGDTMIETIFKHLNDQPLSLPEARPDISFPQAFEDLTMKLLAKKPEDRFQRISEVKQELLNIQSGALKGSGKKTSPKQKSAFNLTKAAAACIAGATLSLIGVVSLLMAHNALDQSEEENRESSRKLRTAEDLNDTAKRIRLSLSQMPAAESSISANDASYDKLLRLDQRRETLDLSGTNVTNTSLPALMRLKQLHTLSLAKTAVTDPALETLLRLTALTSLDLSDTHLSATALAKLASLPTLRKIYLDGTAADDTDLLTFSTMNNLELLSLRDTAISDKGLEHISKSNKLSTLSISGTNITNQGLAAIGSTKLTTLDMWDTKASAGALEKLRQCKTITSLTISRMKLSVGDLDALSGFDRLTYLELYHIPSWKSGDLRYLTKLKSLTTLYVEDCPMTDDDARWLKLMPQLTGLSLNRTKITDRALIPIGDLSKLKNLWLDSADISDAGLKSLAKLKSLKNLHINACPIADKGLMELASLPNITSVEAYYCPGISRRGVAAFKAIKPNCKVTLNYSN